MRTGYLSAWSRTCKPAVGEKRREGGREFNELWDMRTSCGLEATLQAEVGKQGETALASWKSEHRIAELVTTTTRLRYPWSHFD